MHHAIQMLGGVFDEPIKPVEPPVEKPEPPVDPPVEEPEEPTTPPSTEDLLTIKIEDEIMAVVGTNTWNAIAYGNGKYVAVGANGYVTTSTDGTNWTTPKQVCSYSLNGVTFANGKFVACGAYSYIVVSTDGINWTTHKVEESANYLWVSVKYCNGKFIAVGSSGRISTSTDGVSWTKSVWYDSGVQVNCVVYGNGQYIAVDNRGSYGISTDGISWTKRTFSKYLYSSSIVYANGVFVLAGYSSSIGYILTSIDGDTWNITYENDYSKTDPNQKPVTCDVMLDVAHDGMQFIVVGYHAGYIDRTGQFKIDLATLSKDGNNWSFPVPIQDGFGNNMNLTKFKFVIMGN